MKPSELIAIVPSKEQGTISIQVKGEVIMRIIGASLPIPCASYSQLITLPIAIKASGIDVVAIMLERKDILGGKHIGWSSFPFILKIDHTKPESKEALEFEVAFDRVAGIDRDGMLNVIIGEKRYWWKPYLKADNVNKEIGGYVPDPNILCRFIAGTATPDEVQNAATAFVEEQQARLELPVLKEKYDRLIDLLNITEKERNEFYTWRNAEKERADEMSTIANTLGKNQDRYHDLLERLVSNLNGRTFVPKYTKNILSEIEKLEGVNDYLRIRSYLKIDG